MEVSGLSSLYRVEDSGWCADRSGIRTAPPSAVSSTLDSGNTYNVGGGGAVSSSSSSRSVVWVSGGDAELYSNSSPMVVAAMLEATSSLGIMTMSVSVMVVVTPAMVLVVMWKCLYVSSSPPIVWCHHPPSPMHSVWILTPPLPPPRTTYRVDAGRRLSIEQKY